MALRPWPFALILLLALAGAALWYFLRPADAKSVRVESKAKPSAIAEAKPAVVTNKPVAKAAKPKKEKVPEPPPPPKPYKDEFGNLWIAPDKPYRDPNAIKVVYADREEPLEKIFKRTCDIRIGQMLSIEPGESVEMPVFGKSFDRDFQESILEKIEVLPEDDEYTRNMKEAVADVRKELVARVKEGENPSEAMTEAWRELYVLGQYKQNLQADLMETVKQNGAAAEDADALIDAADKMLEAKGLPAFKNRRFLSRMLKLNALRNKEDAQ